MLMCDLNEPEENTIAQFLGGLKSVIANTVQPHSYMTIQDVINLVSKVKK